MFKAFHSTASTARSPAQLTTYTGFSGRSTFPCTVQPQASKDKYTPLPGRRQGTQWVPSALLSLSLRPCHSAPCPSNVRLPGAREPALPGLLQGREARGRGGQLRWTRVPPSARGVSLPSPLLLLLPSTRAARGQASPCASVRNSPARPFPLVHTKRRWLLPRPHAASPHAATY